MDIFTRFLRSSIAKLFILSLIYTLSTLNAKPQNLRVNGKKIIDESGKEIILRGMGLGGWMLQEPYMMEMSDIAGNQTQIRAKIESLIGAAATQDFYNAWLKNHFTKKDVDSLASWGFNSIRLPMHYNLFTYPIEKEPIAGSNTWLEKGFVMTDSLVKWCSDNRIYLILDLHAAPGGQGKDAAISDYNSSKPSLWESDLNKQKTIALWRKLAQRYANEPWIGGYDIINEPNWSFTSGGNQNGCSENSNIPLRQLLVDITSAIRQVDNNHIIIIEGNCWGNNYNGMLPPWDQNMVLSFHKYWSNNDVGSIQGIMNLRDQYNLPIWLGESGENSNTWFTDAIRLVEDNDIGWAWWPLKKIGSINSPYSIAKTQDYQNLLNYWKNGGTAPSATSATKTLLKIAENAKSENCIYRSDVLDAMFRQVQDSTPVSFTNHIIPGTIYTTDYDLGLNGVAYYDADIADYHVTTGTYTSWNTGWSYRNDGVDIEASTDSDPVSNHYNVGWTQDSEWLSYTTEVDSTAAYNLQIRYASSSAGCSVKIISNGVEVTGAIPLTYTGGSQNWNNALVSDVVLYEGKNIIKLFFEKGGANLGFINFTISKKTAEVPFKSMFAETYNQTEKIYLHLNKNVAVNSISLNGFSCLVNGTNAAINSIVNNPNNNSLLIITLNQKIANSDNIKLSYSGGQVLADDGTQLESFSSLSVKNNLPKFYAIPGKLEAEAFYYNQGLVLETTTDLGGGQNIGYTNSGDYLDYRVNVAKTAKYKIEIRVASAGSAGTIELQQMDFNGTILNNASTATPVTGGWQTWTTIRTEMNLNEGECKLRVKVIQPEFNINWYNFNESTTRIAKNSFQNLNFFPNPAHDIITIVGLENNMVDGSLVIRNTAGIVVKEVYLSLTGYDINVYVGDLFSGFYILELNSGNKLFRNKLIVA